MSNKLQELADKLYNEGLSKGKQDGETLVEQAQTQAADIVEEASRKAAEIENAAKKLADETKANAEAEIKLAGRRIVGEVKQTIENMIVATVVSPDVKRAFNDIDFVKSLIRTAIEKFNPADGTNADDLFLLVPDEQKRELEEYVKQKIADGLQAKGEANLNAGFKIGVKSGEYHIGFTDNDFDNLFRDSLRPKISDLLFGK